RHHDRQGGELDSRAPGCLRIQTGPKGPGLRTRRPHYGTPELRQSRLLVLPVGGRQGPQCRFLVGVPVPQVSGRGPSSHDEAPAPLFLQGWALVQAGQKQEGEKLMKLARWLPLANGEARYLLTEAMTKRGLNDLALREQELTARVGDMPDWYTGTALSSQGSA